MFSESVIDKLLKGGRSIGESKGHDQIFKESISGSEGSFPFITFLDSDEVVGSSQINVGEDLGSRDSVDGF